MNSTQQAFVQPLRLGPEPRVSDVAPTPTADQPFRVLLVEDSAINQKVMLKQLQLLGYEVDAVGNGQEAVAAVSQTAYDIILMDCQMPVLNGVNAAHTIRQLETQALHRSHPAVIIAMTANTLWQDQEKAIAAGMDDYLSKPVRKEVLAATLQHWSNTLLSVRQAPNITQCKQDFGRVEQDVSDLQIDWHHLHQISDNNTEFELELLQLFLEDCQAHLTELKAAIATQNFQQIEQEAHHIKGASANVGISTMEVAAGQLEYQARQQELTASHSLVSELEASLQHLKTLISNTL